MRLVELRRRDWVRDDARDCRPDDFEDDPDVVDDRGPGADVDAAGSTRVGFVLALVAR